MAIKPNPDDIAQASVSMKENTVTDITQRLYRQYGKRLFDIIFAIVGIVLCAIPMFVIAILVRMTSPGPALFCQLRAGRKGKLFVLYKFRSMYTGAPEKSNKDFTPEAMNHYLTKIGKFMRKTSIDELPQMINVLRGEMSFIGPRPLAKSDSYVLNLRAVSGADKIRPGISGLAQVNGRNEISDNLKAKWDAEYAMSCGFVTDVRILLRTIGEVALQRGINKSVKNSK
ncbi:MAG: sugar transferase [Lactobacillus sp.]|jgi:O-antigen biosynthesis protein WbqP|nr:sugar transferase [Lactobacillus sp.]